jgi:iron complex transport system substrate-binding protein
MRIASLVPSATELLFALGLGDSVVAVTHECDWPARAAGLPALTRSVIPPGLSAAEIDTAVRERSGQGQALYELDAEQLERLGVELIVTQAVCEVCAVSYDDVVAAAATLPSKPAVVSLDPLKLEDVLDDIARIGAVAGAAEAARELRERSDARLQAVATATAGRPRPRVLALEWLDPPFVAGHWVPEMIELAGGLDVAGAAGQKSRNADWRELEELSSDVAIVMPCGYDAAGSAREGRTFGDRLAALDAERVVAVNASAYFSRPGPRLIDGVELLASILHPGSFDAPAGESALDLGAPRPG